MRFPNSDWRRKRAALEKASGHKVHLISGVSGEGVNTVLRAMAREINQRRTVRAEEAQYAPARARAPHPRRTPDGQFQRAGGAPAQDQLDARKR